MKAMCCSVPENGFRTTERKTVINQKVVVDRLRELIHLLFGSAKYVWREISFVVGI